MYIIIHCTFNVCGLKEDIIFVLNKIEEKLKKKKKTSLSFIKNKFSNHIIF